MKKVRVLIVDDSAVMRKYLTDVLSKSTAIEVVGSAIDPFVAVNKIEKLQPHVITLDVEMPKMDGITFLSKLMIAHPMPVIMVSTLTGEGATETLKALELGAFDFIKKPLLDNDESKKEFGISLIEKVLGTREAKISYKKPVKKYDGKDKLSVAKPDNKKILSDKVIAIGASTGGTVVIEEILLSMSENVPGIVITQHMPENFTKAFADRVNSKCELLVKEAVNGERVYEGMALIAPGGKHMLLKKDHKGYYVSVTDDMPVNRHKPSVDVLFDSVAKYAGKQALGIICTGMGRDGALGLLKMRDSGAKTIAQDEMSCVVYGMPREAVLIGAADIELNIEKIIEQILQY